MCRLLLQGRKPKRCFLPKSQSIFNGLQGIHQISQKIELKKESSIILQVTESRFQPIASSLYRRSCPAAYNSTYYLRQYRRVPDVEPVTKFYDNCLVLCVGKLDTFGRVILQGIILRFLLASFIYVDGIYEYMLHTK